MGKVIRHTYVLSVKQQTGRKDFSTGTLLTWGFPYEDIIFHEGPYCKDYATPSDVKRAAKADGFDFFVDIYMDFPVDDTKQICICWGMCSILRRIAAESDSIALMLLNDIILFGEFWKLNNLILEKFPRSVISKSFVLQLSYIAPGRDRESHLQGYDESIFAKGFIPSSDFATVVSPLGARFLLNEIAKQPWCGFATLFSILSKQNVTGAFHTTIPFVVEANNDALSQTPNDKGLIR